MESSTKIINIRSANRYQVPNGSYITIDDASLIRVTNVSSGGQTLDVYPDTGGGTRIQRLAVAPYEVLYVRKNPEHAVASLGSSLSNGVTVIE